MSDDVLKMSVDRGFTWMDDETLALIDIWGAEEVQRDLINVKRNFGVYERIAAKLAEVGFSRTAYQCREKIKRLRKEYHVAHYCVLHNLEQKKPMKYYELVDKVFNKATDLQSAESHNSGQCSSDQEEASLHFSFDPDSREGFLQNDTIASSTISKSECESNFEIKNDSQSEDPKSPAGSNDSCETLLVNNKDEDFEDRIGVYEKDDTLDESISPWVPNVVLVENDDDNKDFNLNCSNSGFSDVGGEPKSMMSQRTKQSRDSFHSVDDEPPQKKRKNDVKSTWFKSMMDKVTDKFICYQETADARFLERVVLLERERIKKDEAMQKLWIEFEERRRKDERQHEIRMMSLFNQFLNQLCSNINSA